jgi:N-acetylglucosamine-6-phosphate deacetylase
VEDITEGYFDLQVNGCVGVDFNRDDLTAEGLHKTCAALRDGGVDGFLATIITEEVPVMCRRLHQLVALREKDELARRMIAGLHVEGPFLNETVGYRGAHPQDAIRPADPDAMERILEAGAGLVRLVTLAPERDPAMAVTRMLTGRGLVVSAGHTNASMDELRAAIDAGLSLVTHAGNGCPMEMNRHDNIIQRVMSLAGKLTLCLIADGAHLPFFVLQNFLRAAGIENCVVVTDAMAASGLGPGRYTIGRWDVLIGEDMVARSPDNSHLIGSTVTMRRSMENLRDRLGLSAEQIRRLMIVNPRRAVRMDGDLA